MHLKLKKILYSYRRNALSTCDFSKIRLYIYLNHYYFFKNQFIYISNFDFFLKI